MPCGITEREVQYQARAQNILDVLDPSYIPPNQKARDLFVEQQKFMYVVFEKTLYTDKEKALVRSYQSTFDTFCDLW